jgi:hypothetical protein
MPPCRVFESQNNDHSVDGRNILSVVHDHRSVTFSMYYSHKTHGYNSNAGVRRSRSSTQDTTTDTTQSALSYLQAQHAQDPQQLCALHVARQQLLHLQNVNHRDIRQCVV